MSTTIQNKIQLKRGSTAPGTGILDQGEPGYDLTNKRLYIGNDEDDSVLPTCFPNSNEVVFQGEDVEDGGSVIINADSLNGHPASDFAPAGLVSGGFQATATGQIASGLLNYYHSMKDLTIMQVYIEVEVNGLELSGGRWMATIYRQHGSLAVVKALDLINGYERQTTITNGVVGEWEWVNPSMITGEEYRTTERWNGKPIYMKMIDFGALPSNTYKDITAFDFSPIAVRIEGFIKYTGENTYAPLTGVSFVDSVQVMNSRVRITTNTASATNWSATVVVYYTKS